MPILITGPGGSSPATGGMPATAQFGYQGSAYNFPHNSGVFLESDTGTQGTAGTQSNGTLLQYGQANKIGVIDDVTPVAALTRVFAEVGTLLTNVVTLSYDMPPLVLAYDGVTMIPALLVKQQLLAMATAQHQGTLVRYYDSEGNNWIGILLLTAESFERQAGGGLKFDASFYQVS